MKIVSLLPSATEIVYALGLDDHLVGVTFQRRSLRLRARGAGRVAGVEARDGTGRCGRP